MTGPTKSRCISVAATLEVGGQFLICWSLQSSRPPQSPLTNQPGQGGRFCANNDWSEFCLFLVSFIKQSGILLWVQLSMEIKYTTQCIILNKNLKISQNELNKTPSSFIRWFLDCRLQSQKLYIRNKTGGKFSTDHL